MKMLKSSILYTQIRQLSKQKLPAGLTEKLLHGARNRKSFPKAPKSLSLARNLAQANVSLPQFIKQIQPYVAKRLPKSDEILLIDDGEIQDYLVALKNITENQDEYLNLNGGILNFHCHYKIAELLEKNAKDNIEPKNEFEEFCEMYKEINLPFWMQTRPETINEYNIKRLSEIGLHRISFGIEHGNEEFRRKILDRRWKNKDIIEVLKIPHRYGVTFSCNI